MPRYRIITVPSGKPHSDWRSTTKEAVEDAIRLDLADRDDEDPRELYWDDLVMIEFESDDGAAGVIDPRAGASF